MYQDELFQNYKNILNAITNPIIILDLEKRIKFVNTSALNIMPKDAGNVIGKKCSCMNTPYCNTKDCCVERFLRGEAGMVQKGPGKIANRVSLSELKNDKGERIGYISVSTDVHELMETQRELMINEERYQIALKQSQSILWQYDPYAKTITRIDSGNQHTSKILHNIHRVENFPDVLWEKGMMDKDSLEEAKKTCEDILNGKKECECVLHLFDEHHDSHWFHIFSTSIFDKDGTVLEAIGISKDITDLKQLELEYHNEKEYRAIISSDFVSVFEVDLTADKMLNVNKRWMEEMNLKEDATYDDLTQRIVEYMHPDYSYIKAMKTRENMLECFSHNQKELVCEYRKLVNGEYRWIHSVTRMYQHKSSGHVIACTAMKDIEDEKRKEAQWRYKAERDLLTGVYNHSTIVSMINAKLKAAPDVKHAFIIMDLDNFKDINDLYGHMYGDLVLKNVSAQLCECFKEHSIIGRIGGDEFVVFLSDLHDQISVISQCEKFCDDLSSSTYTYLKNAHISVSIGLAFYDKNQLCFDDLYHKADIAMYYGKYNGKNQCSVYQNGMFDYTQSNPVDLSPDVSGPLEGNIREFIFRTLFTSSSTDFTHKLDEVLRLTGHFFQLHHAVILSYDNQMEEISVLNEWKDSSMGHEKMKYHVSLMKECLSTYPDISEHAVFIYENKNNTPFEKAILASVHAKAITAMSMALDEVNSVMVIFCDNLRARSFTRQQRNDLQTIMEIIEIFLQNQAQKTRQNEQLNMMMYLLNHIGSAIYIIDPATYHLIYFNEDTKRLFPYAEYGSICHKCFRGSEHPCEDCPVKLLEHRDQNDRKVVDIYNSVVHQWVRTTASYIDWPDGHLYILLSCTDITDYMQ